MALISDMNVSAAKILHEHFKDHVVNTLGDIEELKFFKQYKISGEGLPAESRIYKVRMSEGSKSVGARALDALKLPRGQEVRYEEGKIHLKRYDMTLEFAIEALEALKRSAANGDFTSAAFQSAEEHVNDIIKAKTNMLAHVLLTSLFGDGTGVLGQVSSVTIAGGKLTVNLKSTSATDQSVRGAVNWFRLGQDVIIASPAGALRTYTGGTPDSLTVESIDIANNRIVLQPRDAQGNAITTVTATTIVADDVIYNGCKADVDANEIVLPNLGTITDYDTASANILGLRGLVRDSGVVQGLTRSGVHASQIITAASLSPDLLTKLIISLKRRMSGSMSSLIWKAFMMSDEALDSLIRANMNYRALNVALSEARRGVPAAYGAVRFEYAESVSGKNETWEIVSSVFCPINEIYAIPQAGRNDRGVVLGFMYTEPEDPFADFSTKDGFLPRVDSDGRYMLSKISHKRMWACLYSELPAALGKIVVTNI